VPSSLPSLALAVFCGHSEEIKQQAFKKALLQDANVNQTPRTQVLFVRRSSRYRQIISEVMRLNQKTKNSSPKLPQNICLLLAWYYAHLHPPASPG